MTKGTVASSTFYAFDPQGSVAERVTSAGTVSASLIADAYGAVASTASAGSDPFGYEAQDGYYSDAATGLVLCGHRLYGPAQGRWINRDPIGYDGGLNLYGYVGDNPISLVDPSGYSPDKPPHIIKIGGPLIIVSGTLAVDTDGGRDPSLHSKYYQPDTSFEPGGRPLDAGTVPYGVYYQPKDPPQWNHGVGKGDLGVIGYNGKLVPFVFGDAGHSLGGEASAYVHKKLGNNFEPRLGVFTGIPSGVTVYAFPKSRHGFHGPYTPGAISACAMQLYGKYILHK